MQEETYTIPQMVEDVRRGKLPRRHFIKTLAAMGISAAGIEAIGAAASRPLVTTAAPRPKVHEEPKMHLKLHDQHLTAQSQGNTSDLHNDYAEHAVVEDSMHAQPFVGHEAVMARKSGLIAAAANAQITVTNRVVHGNQVTAEWVATGTHVGDLPGLPASGRQFSLRGVTVVVREQGKIVREAIYYDVSELHRQLGQVR